MLGRIRSALLSTVAAASVGVTAGYATPARADCAPNPQVQPGHLDRSCPDVVGYPMCLQAPVAVPGLSGMPVWPADVLHPASASERPEVTDPRWGNAPLHTIFSVNNDANARFRILADNPTNPKQLAVSIQMQEDWGSPGGADSYVYFGITDDAAAGSHQQAWGVQIGAAPATANATGNDLPIKTGLVSTYVYTSGTGWTNPDQGAWPSSTPWVTSASSALWNSTDLNAYDTNGAAYAVQFKVDLHALGLDHANARVLISLGVHNDFSDAQVRGLADYSTPNQGAYVDPSTRASGPFHPYIEEWTPVAAFGTPCLGVNVEGMDISTALGTISGHAAVTVAALAPNTFQVSPSKLSSIHSPASGDLKAQFYMSNWGTNAVGTAAGWLKVPGPLGSWDGALTDPITSQCTNTTANQVCGTPIVTACQTNSAGVTTCDPTFHQCLQVQLSPGINAGGRVTFENASAYTNTRFGTMSQYEQVAEINVRGLQALLGNSNARDVYLHVVPHNLPPASNVKMHLDVPALESLRSQVDSWFAKDKGYCPNPTDLCGDGVCVPTCARMPGCTQTYTYNNVCYCTAKTSGSCSIQGVAPAGGGYDQNKSSITRAGALRAEYPTLDVYPYYDSGKTRTVRGQARKILIPMQSFTVHATHTGDFYGFLYGLTMEDNTQITKVAPDIYKLSVPNETTARVRVMLSAEEQPHYSPLTEIVGTATPLPLGLGNVTLTGVSNTATPIDLSKGQMVLTSLLSENGVERVTNLAGPVTLVRQPGATTYAATFVSSGFGKPTVTVNVVTLPLIGQTVQITVIGASVQQPASCPLFFGTTNLTTQFSLTDGTAPPLAIRGTDQWTCVPFQLINL